MGLFRCTVDNQYDGIVGYRKGQVYTFPSNPAVGLFEEIPADVADKIIVDETPMPAHKDLEGDWHVHEPVQFEEPVVFNDDVDIDTIVTDAIEFKDDGLKPWKAGQAQYDHDNGCLLVDTVGDGVRCNVGQESFLPYDGVAHNLTGSTIVNGTPVLVCSSGSQLCLRLANANIQSDAEMAIAVATEDIPDGSHGYCTTFGLVNDVLLTKLPATAATGDTLWISETDGEWVNERPSGGTYRIAMAVVGETSATTANLFVRYAQLTDPADIKRSTGFPTQNASTSTLSFDDATRTLSVAPSATEFYVWQLGNKYVFDSTQTVQIPDTEGLYYFYFDEGVLNYLYNPTDGQVDNAIRNTVLCAQLYWDATNDEAVLLGNERHGHVMSGDTHAYLHFTRGAQWISGAAMSNVIADGSGNNDTSAQFGVTAGVSADEDVIHIAMAKASTVGLPIFYLDGSGANLRRTTEAGYSVLTDVTAGVGVTGRLVWNEFTGGAWQLSTITNSDFVLCHVFFTNDTEQPFIAFIGQNDYGNRGAARAGADSEISTILTAYPGQELVPLATLIYQSRDTYSNDVAARVISDGDGNDYVDWRKNEAEPGAAPSSHANLANLEWSSANHTIDADLLPDTDATHDLGSAAASWQDVRVSRAAVLRETTTPTAETNYGKIYTKSDNKLYFQDGAGTEHEIAFA